MNNYYDDPPCRQNAGYPQPVQTAYPTGAMPQKYPYVQTSPMPQGMLTPMGIPAATPTGAPTGPSYTAPAVPQLPGVTTAGEAPPTTLQNVAYTAGFLKTQIGQRVRVEFLIGSNGTTDRTGILVAVGASYILLREEDNIIMCDLYSIKFVTIYL